jgi:hypothetical protein
MRNVAGAFRVVSTDKVHQFGSMHIYKSLGSSCPEIQY